MSEDTATVEHQTSFLCMTRLRALVGLSAMGSLYALNLPGQPDMAVVIAMIAIPVYIVVSHLVVGKMREDRRSKLLTVLEHADAAMIGAVVSLIDLNIVPSLLLIAVVQFSAIAGDGDRRLWSLNLALVGGIALVSVLRPPGVTLESDLLANVLCLVPLCFYFCLCGLHYFRQLESAGERIAELEQNQIKLKLRNYHLSKYLSPTLREAILSGRDVKLGTQRKKLTIFFSDIQGFSELAEEMEADALTGLLNNYLTEMSQIALKHGATIDKFIGDAIMVFFGDPISNGAQDDCLACVSMAIEMKKRMKELRMRWANQGIQRPLEIRMGINTGFCTVGNFGTENRLDYTLLGTEVNLASRLESAAEPGEILISHETCSLIKNKIMCRDKGEITVKGFQQPVKVYSVVDMRKNLGKDQTYLEQNTEGFSIYLDTDKIRNYDRERIIKALGEAAAKLKNIVSTRQ